MLVLVLISHWELLKSLLFPCIVTEHDVWGTLPLIEGPRSYHAATNFGFWMEKCSIYDKVASRTCIVVQVNVNIPLLGTDIVNLRGLLR